MSLREKMVRVGLRVSNELGATRCLPFAVTSMTVRPSAPLPCGHSQHQLTSDLSGEWCEACAALERGESCSA